MTTALVTAGPGCPLPLSPLCDAAGSVGGNVAHGILSAIVGWIVAGADWLLAQIASAMAASTAIDVRAPWFEAHYAVMGTVAAAVAVPLVAVAAVQAVWRQSPGVLARVAFVQVPLAALLSAAAIEVVQLALSATDALCATVAAGSGAAVSQALGAVATDLATQQTAPSPVPAFAVGLGALLVVVGAVLLWLELVVRSAALYVAVLFLPLALVSLVSPSLSHWCRRLVETIAALVLSKFVIVAVLSLAAGAVASGNGFPTVLSGAALLLLAALTPFTLLRLVPLVEAGAALGLDGARSRMNQATGHAPVRAASYALRAARDQPLAGAVPGTLGVLATATMPGAPGAEAPGVGAGEAPAVGGSGGAPPTGDLTVVGGAPMWRGDPRASAVVAAAQAHAQALGGDPGPLPDGAGGTLPGVEMPLWGGNLPGARLPPPGPDRGVPDPGDDDPVGGVAGGGVWGGGVWGGGPAGGDG